MTEAAEKLSDPPGNPGEDIDGHIPGWTLHLTLLLTILSTLFWLRLTPSPSPAPPPTSTDHVQDDADELAAPLLALESSPLSIPRDSSPLAGTSQSHVQTETSEQAGLLPTATVMPEMGQRPQRPPFLMTSRGGARPAFVPNTFTLVPDAVPHTNIPDRPRLEVITYNVQSGDTLIAIANAFRLKPDTIIWASGRLVDHPDLLQVGQTLTILPVDGIYHTVQKGETLQGIAKQYKVEVDAITSYEYNGLQEPYELVAGQHIIVPGGQKPYVPRVVHAYTGAVPSSATKGSGSFVWPASGRITQGYLSYHKAIDIGAPTGRPVLAADAGYVASIGWSQYGYGNCIILDHGNGFQTLYAHLSAILVEAGQSVAIGERIGSVGSTGRSTGPHLHFEVRYKGAQRNPLGYLP
jgi:murein DD-endopeptidase MepM/ murein hydrolase activator NlpD